MVCRKTVSTFAAAVFLAVMLSGCGADNAGQSQQDTSGTAQDSGGQTSSLPVETDSVAALPEFTAKDLDGNEVTDDIFSQKDVTVVNIWGTFCGPCVEEMPELGEWAAEMPDNVQLVGILVDVPEGDEDQITAAKEILDAAKADFVNVVPSGKLVDWVGNIMSVPTTILVNKEGRIIGEPMVGAYVQGYKDAVEAYLDGK